MILEDEIPKIGGELVWIRVGDVFVCEELKKHNAALAMEISAHFFAPGLTDFIFDDPIIFSLKLAEYLNSTGEKLSATVTVAVQVSVLLSPSEVTVSVTMLVPRLEHVKLLLSMDKVTLPELSLDPPSISEAEMVAEPLPSS